MLSQLEPAFHVTVDDELITFDRDMDEAIEGLIENAPIHPLYRPPEPRLVPCWEDCHVEA